MKLLELFKTLTIYPQNAEQLKGLILQLAIQGKLTQTWREQHPDVEPASVLLERIKAEKEKLIKEKKIKKEKALPEIEENEIPFALPQSWEWTRLSEIGTTNVGLTYKPAHITNDGVPVLRSSNIQNSIISLDDLIRVNTDYREKDIIKEGDLLICARNGSRKLVGKCAIIESIDETMVFGAFMAIFRSQFNRYLKLFIQSPQYRSRLDGVETTTINQITQGNLKSTEVPLPPLEEQKAIISIVDQLFKEIDELEAQTKQRVQLKEDFVQSALRRLTEAPDTVNSVETLHAKSLQYEWTFLQSHFKSFFNTTASIKKLRETILQLAVQGKLTAHWRTSHPNTEPASVLLAKIKAEKEQLVKEKKIKKEKPLPAIADDEIPYELPDGWSWCRLTQLVDVGTGSTPSKTNHSYYYRGTIPWFTSSATNNLYTEVAETLITEKALAETNCKIFPVGSLIIALYGQGKTRGQISELKTAGTTNQAIAAMVFFESSKEIRQYVKYYFQKIYHEIRLLAEGGAQPNLNVGKIKNTLIPLPPLEEQKAIVSQVNQLMALCEQLEQQIQQNTQQVEDLMASCVKEALEGDKEEKGMELGVAAEPRLSYGKP